MTLKIGIVGGGQLGRFLCQAARQLGMQTTVMTARHDDPACSEADHVLVADLADVAGAARLADAVDVITFEIESVAPAVLEVFAEAARAGRVQVRPSAAVMTILRNKATQKRWLASHGLPTAPFRVVDDPVGPLAPGDLADLSLPVVQKAQVGGYDGRGVHVIRSVSDLAAAIPGPCILEDFVEHQLELAVLVARSASGEVACYEPVELRFDHERHVLDEVRAPADVAAPILASARMLAQRAVELLDGVGVFALELFLTPAGDLLINEISPRVHNTGHLTLEACETSQFEQHLRAIADLPLGPVRLKRAAAMRNLLWRGAPAAVGELPTRLPGSDASIHWYGKTWGHPWRKMGHLTTLGDSAAIAAADADEATRAVLALTNGGCG